MTISSTTRVAGPFTGNGTASAFPFAWKVFAAADLDVVRRNVTSGTDTVLVLNTDYTVTLNGNQNTNPGGTVTLVAGPLASGFTLTLTSDLANLQPTDLTNQGGFYPEVINDSLDRATIQIQQLAGEVSRSIRAPVADGSPAMVLPPSEIRSNGFLAFDGNGLPTIQAAASGAAPTSITRQVFSGDGTTTVFNLSTDPGGAGNSAQVFIGGVYQQRNTYTINGTVLTFSQAPVAGTNNIEFVNFLIGSGANGVGIVTLTGDVTGSGTGTVPATIAADSVTFAKMQNIATDRLLGRDTAGTGDVEQITLGAGLEFSGSGAIRLRDMVNVKDYGAVGDGVADDTAAIIAADAAAAVAGRRVYFPAGTYNVGGRSAALAPSVTWVGDSSWYNQFAVANFAPPSVGTVIDAGSANLDTISQNLTAREILNINFKGTGTGAHVNVQSGTRMLRIHNCAMHGKDHAIKVSGAVAYILRFSKIFAVRQASSAILLDFGSGSFNDIEIRDSWIFRPDGGGIVATQTTGGCTLLSIIGNDVTDGTGANAAISISGVSGLRIVGNDIEGWGAIYSDPVNLTGKTGYQNDARCIEVSGSSAIIEGNVTYGCGNNHSPIRTLTLFNSRIGPNRLLKDLSTQTYGISVDAASANITIEPHQHDYPVVSIVSGSATGIVNRASGSVVSNATQTFDGALTVNGNTTLKNITESVVAIGTVGVAGHTFDLTNGTVQTATLTDNEASTFTMPTATAGKRFTFIVKQPASGTPATATFSGVLWPGGSGPTITASLDAIDIIRFVADGTSWYGTFEQDFS